MSKVKPGKLKMWAIFRSEPAPRENLICLQEDTLSLSEGEAWLKWRENRKNWQVESRRKARHECEAVQVTVTEGW